jgi:sugar-specific transcriptional regulator TrmB
MTVSRNLEILLQLGLACNEAKLFLALAENETATAKALSCSARVAREIVYQTMPKLQQKGLVEKIISKPTLYRAIPIEQAAANLLKSKNRELRELHSQTQELVSNIKRNSAQNSPAKEESQFAIISGKDIIIQKLRSKLQKTKFTLDVVTSLQRFAPAILEFAECYEDALRRGLHIRIATQKQVIGETTQKVLNTLERKPHFKVRYFSETPKAVVSIFDNSEFFVTLSSTINLKDSTSLWSNNPSLIELAQSYFENKWSKASETATTHMTPLAELKAL